MLKVLEPKPKKIKDNDSATAAKCTCICKVTKHVAGPQQPETNMTLTEIGVQVDISG